VNLSGEAYFHVKSKRSPFLIHTRYTTVEVSGTAFNVRESKNGDVTVSVKDGEVKFFDKGGKHEKLTLGPGSEGIYRQESESMTRKDLHSENFLFWKTDSLAFKLETLDKVFSSLEEHYNVVIRVMDDEILKHRLTTSFKNQDITSIMDEISEYFDLRYSIRKDTIITEIRP
jgi:ferric-dicitrate binding protein FerR (iron transport regulator)